MGNAIIISSLRGMFKKKRKVGMRAGMTRAKIADAATKLWLSGGADNFSIPAVAAALFVTAVENHNEINAIWLSPTGS
jgi:hypothetical protein